MKAIHEIGWKGTWKFATLTIVHSFYRLLIFPPLRVVALRALGAKVGKGVIIHSSRFFNFYRTGFQGLAIGDHCFLGDECLIDLADSVILEEHVTLAERVTIVTHTNVGYADHPLQPFLPPSVSPVIFRRGAFVGACSTILAGVEIGRCAVVAAGSLVHTNVPPFTMVGGVPARPLRTLQKQP